MKWVSIWCFSVRTHQRSLLAVCFKTKCTCQRVHTDDLLNQELSPHTKHFVPSEPVGDALPSCSKVKCICRASLHTLHSIRNWPMAATSSGLASSFIGMTWIWNDMEWNEMERTGMNWSECMKTSIVTLNYIWFTNRSPITHFEWSTNVHLHYKQQLSLQKGTLLNWRKRQSSMTYDELSYYHLHNLTSHCFASWKVWTKTSNEVPAWGQVLEVHTFCAPQLSQREWISQLKIRPSRTQNWTISISRHAYSDAGGLQLPITS